MTHMLISLLWATQLLFSAAPALADQATYIYDDLGRLSQVIDGQGHVATYSYDAVGNLLSIARNTGGVGAPTITGLTPNSGAAGSTVVVTLTGTNLTGAALATDNPGIQVQHVVTTPLAAT
ncbi:MAG: RHS repeat protein [Nitrospira sp.]|nr:RHS repeat protein [Nitrospira sp.]